GPVALAPVAKAAGLREQQVEQGQAIAGIVARVVPGLIPALVEAGAQPRNGIHHVAVALDPAAIVGPRRAVEVERRVTLPDAGDGPIRGPWTRRRQRSPDPVL